MSMTNTYTPPDNYTPPTGKPQPKPSDMMTKRARRFDLEEEALLDAGISNHNQRMEKLTDAKTRRQRAVFYSQQAMDSPKRSDAVEQQYADEIKAIDEEIADIERLYQESNAKTGSAHGLIHQDFLPKVFQILKPGDTFEDYDESDEAFDGKSDSEMLEYRRDEAVMLRKEAIRVDTSTYFPKEDTRRVVTAAVRTYAGAIGVGPAMRRARGNANRPGSVSWPQTADGKGGLRMDPGAVLFEVFGDSIIEHIMAKVEARHAEGVEIFTAAERKAKVAELEALAETAERKAMFWFRRMRALGMSPMLPTADMMIFLGLRVKRAAK